MAVAASCRKPFCGFPHLILSSMSRPGCYQLKVAIAGWNSLYQGNRACSLRVAEKNGHDLNSTVRRSLDLVFDAKIFAGVPNLLTQTHRTRAHRNAREIVVAPREMLHGTLRLCYRERRIVRPASGFVAGQKAGWQLERVKRKRSMYGSLVFR